MRKALAISASAVAFVSGVANGAESKPVVSPSSTEGPGERAPGDRTEPRSPSSNEPRTAEENRASWSPTSTWRPGGPSTYDENQRLAELLNMSATVATKSSSSVSLSPGIVTVYGEKDIRRLGYYTIADLADITAGYSSYSIYGEKVLETRGQKAGSFVNNKHLVLIDGIPVNHGRGNKAMIDESVPLFFANRVEFLKGPASALYGTGAFFGVVNIAPKELDEPGFRAEWRAGLGSNQGEKRVAANAMYRDGARHAAIYAGFYDKGPSMELTGTMDNPDNRLWDNQRSVFLYLTYGVDAGPLSGVKAGFIYASKNGGLGEFWLAGYSPPYDDLTWVQMIPYVKYERALGHSFRFDGYLKASRDIEQATAAMGQARSAGTGDLALLYRFGVSTYEGLAEIRWEPSEIVNIIGGVDVNVSYQYDGAGSYGGKISGDPGPVFRVTPGTLTSHDVFQTYSPFLQLQQTLPVLTALHVTAGARLDTGKAMDVRFAQLSPRLGLVEELTPYLSLKALFGTALRAPGSKEFGLNSEAFGDLTDNAKVQVAETPLQPEIIQSLEGAVSLNTTHVSANLVVFVNETHSALNERPEEGKNGRVNFFTNSSSKIVARGTELEVTLAATPDARIFANYAVAKAELQSDVISPTDQMREQSQLSDVPIHKVNAGASYRVDKPIDVTGSVVGKWVKGYRGARPIDPWLNPPSVPSLDEAMRVGDHFVLDANFGWRASEHTSLELMVRNVLNEFYKVPQGGVPYVPMPRRSVHVTLDYRW